MGVQFFSHVGVCTADLTTSRRFFREALGFVEVTAVSVGPEVGQLIEVAADDLRLDSVFLERDGARIELMGFTAPDVLGDGQRGAFNSRGLTHFAVRTDEIDATAALVRKLGGTVLEETRVGEPGLGVELMYVLDPDGVRIELIQLPGDPTVAPGEPIAGPT